MLYYGTKHLLLGSQEFMYCDVLFMMMSWLIITGNN